MSTHHRCACFATTISGLGHLLAGEAGALGLQPTADGNDGRDDVVAFGRARWPAVGRLRIAERVFVHLADATIESTARSTARQLSVDQVTAGLVTVGDVEGRSRHRVRLVVRLGDERRFTRSELRDALVRRLRPIVTTAEGATVAELWVLHDGPTRLRVGLRVSTLGARAGPPRGIERPGALRPAAAMIRLVERPGVVLDPCCGTGTVAVEAEAAGRRGLAGDLDPDAVAGAAANGVTSVTRLGARRLPFAANGVAAVVTNLPFGRSTLSRVLPSPGIAGCSPRPSESPRRSSCSRPRPNHSAKRWAGPTPPSPAGTHSSFSGTEPPSGTFRGTMSDHSTSSVPSGSDLVVGAPFAVPGGPESPAPSPLPCQPGRGALLTVRSEHATAYRAAEELAARLAIDNNSLQ